MFRKTYLPLIAIRLFPVAAQTFFILVLLYFNGPSFTGETAFFLAGVAVFRAIVPLGLDLEVLRVSSRTISDQGALNRRLLTNSIAKALMFTVIGLALLFILAILLPKFATAILAIALGASPGPIIGVLVSFLRPSGRMMKSQIIDAFGSSLAPTLICGLLVVIRCADIYYFSSIFFVAGVVSATFLFSIAMSNSMSLQAQERIKFSNLKSNAISQVLVAINTRIPTLATGLFSSSVIVAYVDLGSKIQLIGGTVAWLFGVVQSPVYARDEGGLSNASLRLISKAARWSGIVVVAIGALVCLLSVPFAVYLQLDTQKTLLAFSIFTIISVIEAYFVSMGYGLSMTGKSNLISLSVLVQMAVSLLGIYLFRENLEGILVTLAISSAARLTIIKILFKKYGSDAN